VIEIAAPATNVAESLFHLSLVAKKTAVMSCGPATITNANGRTDARFISAPVRGQRLRPSVGRSPSGQLARGEFLLCLVEFLLELLGVYGDFLLDRLFGVRQSLVELFFKARLPDHE
jgi:hypothetical protein